MEGRVYTSTLVVLLVLFPSVLFMVRMLID